MLKTTTAAHEYAALEAKNAQLCEDWVSASGALAIVASWLRGSKGDMDDLTAQNIYDMIANELGLPAETITTQLVEAKDTDHDQR